MIKELLMEAVAVFGVLLFVGCVAVGAVYIFKPQADRTEQQFREACVSVGGKAVWNGRYWECLK